MAAKKSDFCFLKTNNTQLKLLWKDHELYLNLFSFSEHARLRARAREWVSSLLTSFFAQNVNKVDCVSLKKILCETDCCVDYPWKNKQKSDVENRLFWYLESRVKTKIFIIFYKIRRIMQKKSIFQFPLLIFYCANPPFFLLAEFIGAKNRSKN